MVSRLPLCAAAFLAAAVSTSAQTPTAGAQFELYFRPAQTDRAAMSHDGRYVAYTVHKGTSLYLQIVPLENPSARKSVAVAEDFMAADFESQNTDREEKQIARLDYLRWVTPKRLVFSCNEGRVFAINADGSDVMTLVDSAEVATNDSKQQRRRPVVVNSVDLPGSKVLIEARRSSHAPADLFVADYATGDVDETDRLDGKYRFNHHLFDNQGRLRSRFVHRTRPQKYEYYPVKGRVKDLDTVAAPAGLTFKVTAQNFLEQRSIPIGFGYDPEILYYTSNVGRDTYGIYSLDLRTGKSTDLKVEHPYFDIGDPDDHFAPGKIVLDRHRRTVAGFRFVGVKESTWWLDPEIAAIQDDFDKKMPHKSVVIQEWDEGRNRFLVNVASSADPGTWFIFERNSGKLIEFARRAPWLSPEVRHPGGPFAFDGPDGTKISGYLTMPRQKRSGRMPLIIYCRESAWGRQTARFVPEVQAIAGMGFAVLQVNHRGCEGFGTRHRLSAQQAVDRIAAEDMIAAIDHVCAREKRISPKLVGVFGFGWGAYFGMRAMQLYPERIRCGVVSDPHADFRLWFNYSNEFDMRTQIYEELFGKDAKKLEELSVVHHAADLKQPLMIIRNEFARDRERAQTEAVRSALARNGNKPEVVNVTREFMRGPIATARTFDQAQGFFNLNIYRFTAEGGDAKVVEDPKPGQPAEPSSEAPAETSAESIVPDASAF